MQIKLKYQGILIISFLITCLIAGFVFYGCSKTGQVVEEVEETIKEQKVAALLWLGLETPYCKPAADAYIRVMEANGVGVKLFDAGFDASKQLEQLYDAISMDVDVVNLIAMDSKAISPGLKKAWEAKIPVIMDHSMPEKEDEKYTVAYSGPYNYNYGLVVAELINTALGGEGKIAIIQGAAGQEATINITQGIKDKLKELKSEIEIIAEQPAEWDKQTAVEITEDWLIRYPELDGIIAMDSTLAAGAVIAMKEAGLNPGDVILIDAMGGSQEGMENVKSGWVYAAAIENPTPAGELGAQVALKVLEQNIIPPKQLDPWLNPMDIPVATQENADDFMPSDW